VIATFQDKEIPNGAELARLVAKNPAGREIALTVVRGGRTIAVKMKPGELPLRWEPGYGHWRATEGA
jgi:S1-C subfamily serine protease